MQKHIIIRSRTAIAVSVMFFVVTCFVLFEDVLRHSAPITVKHALTMAVLVGTMFFGHRAWPELAALRVWNGSWCLALFLAGTIAIVVMSAGRNFEVTGAKNADTREANRKRSELAKAVKTADDARISADAAYSKAIDTQEKAQADAAAECKNGTGPKCRGNLTTVAEAGRTVEDRRRAQEKAERAYWHAVGQLSLAKPEQAENTDLQAPAELIAMLPFVTASVERIAGNLALFMTFVLTLFCEMGTIVSGSIGVGHSPAAKLETEGAETEKPTGSGPGRNRRTRKLAKSETEKPSAEVVQFPVQAGAPKAKDEALEFIKAELGAGRSFPSQDSIVRRVGVVKSTISKWLGEWEEAGILPKRQRRGRFKALSSTVSMVSRNQA